MKRLLSYIYPITKKVKSIHNGIVEVTWFNGKKLLNTKNANYSYGSLQDILKFGISKIDISKIKNSLILGLGGGSVIKTLNQDFNYKNKITAIEIDEVIVTIAKNEFGIKNTNNINIVCTDAFEFLKTNKQNFDFIIIDLFIDNKVPNQFLKQKFWQLIINKNPMYILFNAALNANSEKTLSSIIQVLQNNDFKTTVYTKVEKTNTLLIAKKMYL